ncbi:MAG: hypothetical protein FWG99_03470 [Treponema sp.]|nr:hypothetical protein [Treponema sp.]
MKKYQQIIVISITVLFLIIFIIPGFWGASFAPWVDTKYESIELSDIPVYSQIWLSNYEKLNDVYKKYYFNDSLILVHCSKPYKKQYKIYVSAYSRNEEKAEYFINEYNIMAGNFMSYDKMIYEKPIIIPENLSHSNSAPFKADFDIGNYSLKDKTIIVLINITIKRIDNIETKVLKYSFQRKSTFGLYRGGV